MPNPVLEQSQERYTPATAPDAGTARSAEFVTVAKPSPATYRGGVPLNSPRGVHRDSSLSFTKIVQDSLFAGQGAERDLLPGEREQLPLQREQLQKVWLEARLDGRDCGKALKQIVPLLENDPALLDKLHAVATATRLFNQDLTPENRTQFEKMRREFLYELIQGAANSRDITQGPGALCTATSMLKAMPQAELLRAGCDYATTGYAVTRGGEALVMQDRFIARANSASSGALDTIRCRRPSAGMLMLLDGAMELGVANVTTQVGSYWWQYTDAQRNLRGQESICAGEGARINVNNQGRAVLSSAEATAQVSPFGYMMQSLPRFQQGAGDQAVIPEEVFGAGRTNGILFDTRWNHGSAATGMSSMHGRHMLKAIGVTHFSDGEYVVCENPIGDFINTSATRSGHAEFVAPGTVLGDRNNFWFKTGQDGVVYIRKDVLQSHLKTVLVDLDVPYNSREGSKVLSLGNLSTPGAMVDPIDFVEGDSPASEARSEEQVGGVAQLERGNGEAYGSHRDAKPRTSDDSAQVNHYHRAATGRRKEEEELELLGAVNTAQEKRDSREAPGEIASFGTLGSATTRAMMYGVNGGHEAVVPRDTFERNIIQKTESESRPTSQQPAQAPAAQSLAESPRLKALFNSGE
jgi:hypothetical protein